jgi:PTS system nitrogen regulatory IIA component
MPPDISLILAPRSIRCVDNVASKKLALDVLSQALAAAVDGTSSAEILDGLAARERLGSTGIGDAVAMPHTRMAGIDNFVGAFVKLSAPVEFDAPDGRPVDLLFGLLIPESCSERELRELRVLVKKLRDPMLQESLNASCDPAQLHRILTENLMTVAHA